MTKHSQTELHTWIPPYLRVSNPVDNGGAPVRDWRGPKIIETMLADPNVDLLLCPITGALPSMGNKLCQDLVDAAATTDKPIFVVWGSPVGDEEAYRKTLLAQRGAHLPHLHQRGDGGQGLLRPPPLRRRLHVAVRPPGSPAPVPAKAKAPSHPRAQGQATGQRAARSPSRTPRPCLAAYGIPVPKERVVDSAGDAAKAAKRIGFPVVMKIVSADILHKSDLGLVAVGVRDEDDAKRIYKRMMATAKKAAPKAIIDGVLVAERSRASRRWSAWPRTTCSVRWSCSVWVASSSRCSRT